MASVIACDQDGTTCITILRSIHNNVTGPSDVESTSKQSFSGSDLR